MSATSDCKMTVLTTLLYTGAVSDMLLLYYQARGATAESLPEAEQEFLLAKGAALAPLADMWTEYLDGLGITLAHVDDMKNEFWCDGEALIA